jgi:hypothetical protein
VAKRKEYQSKFDTPFASIFIDFTSQSKIIKILYTKKNPKHYILSLEFIFIAAINFDQYFFLFGRLCLPNSRLGLGKNQVGLRFAMDYLRQSGVTKYSKNAG